MGRTGYSREDILDAGLEVLLRKGYNGTGVKEIVDAAGVPKGSFYNHFASKEDFVIEALQRASDRSYLSAKELLRDGKRSARDRLCTYFKEAAQHLESQQCRGGCLIGNLCLEMADENPRLREVVADMMQRQIDLINDCLQDAHGRGELKAGFQPHELAEFLFYAWEGAVMRAKACKDCRPFEIFCSYLNRYFLNK